MNALARFFEASRPHFEKGGRLEKLYPAFEALDTFAFTPASVTRTTAHVRDALDLKRTMITVVYAMVPCILWAMYNTGLQAHLVMADPAYQPTGWRHELFTALGIAHDPGSVFANVAYGALFLLPVFLACNVTGGILEVTFAAIRKHEVNEGFLVTGWLIPLIVPPTIPLWQVTLGTAFGVVFGKEVFGGTGKNIFNPALMARAFLFFAYPAQISGDQPWVAVDGFSGATALAQAKTGGLASLPLGWSDYFFGFQAGSMGETSEFCALLGGAYLIYTGIGSWRIMLACVAGLVLMSSIFNAIGSATNPMFAVPAHWHFVMGSFVFATVFMATCPVSASMTNAGRWIYGVLIGMMGVMIRVVNPAYPEGWMLSILLMNAFAPTIDYFVMKANINRRMAGHGRNRP